MPKAAAKLAGYMLRAPFATEKMAYDEPTGNVIYRSRMHAELKPYANGVEADR